MLKQSVIDQMKEYQHRQTMIKAVKYQECFLQVLFT